MTYTPTTWTDEVLTGDARYNILKNDGTVIENNAQINLANAVAIPGTPANAANLNNLEAGIVTLDSLMTTLLTGWIAGVLTWTYVSATTLRIPGNVTALFPVGTKIKLTQTTVKYFYVTAASYSSPNTTLTITGGSDYTLANAAITAPHYSYIAGPQGFPQWFNYTPVWTAATTNPVLGNGTLTGRFTINGRLCTALIRMIAGTTTTFGSGNWFFSPPVDYAVGGFDYNGVARVNDTGTANFVCGAILSASGIQLTVNAGTYVAGNAPMTWTNGDSVNIEAGYQI